MSPMTDRDLDRSRVEPAPNPDPFWRHAEEVEKAEAAHVVNWPETVRDIVRTGLFVVLVLGLAFILGGRWILE